ncbi:hypothetical protein ACDY95_29385, partial [Achromobacter ruhlandii]
GIGNATSLPPLIAQAEFAREDAARVVPLIVALSQGAYAFAPAASISTSEPAICAPYERQATRRRSATGGISQPTRLRPAMAL